MMKKTCALMQPTFNPWLGYFDLMDYVDEFIFLDTVQLNQQSWQTRNKLLLQGKAHLFSLPVIKNKSKQALLIKDALLDFRKYDFRKKLGKTLEQNYKKAPHFDEVYAVLKEVIYFDTEFLSVYNIHFIQTVAKYLGIQTHTHILSKTDYATHYTKSDLVLDVCRYFKSNHYVSPLGAKEYLDKSIHAFDKYQVAISYQHYKHPIYRQLGHTFIPYIGVFDILFNEGFENSIKIIRSGRKYENR